MTYTYAILDVTPECYNEIKGRLRLAKYDHAFDRDVIDMHGIALRALPVEETLTARVHAFIVKHPGRTAWGVARELHVSAGSVSSILKRLSERKALRRAKGHAGSWVYYDPKFGHDA